MKIITRAPIEVQSSADAVKSPADSAKTSGKFKAFVQKEKGKVAAGHEKRVANRAARKAKRNARPLTKTGQWFHDHLPRLNKKADGSATKTLPDGTQVDVPKENVAALPGSGVLVDKTDAAGKALITTNVGGVPTATTQYSANETAQATGPDGTVQVYKADDTLDAGAIEEGADGGGMGQRMKIALIIGGAVLVIFGIVILVKQNKK